MKGKCTIKETLGRGLVEESEINKSRNRDNPPVIARLSLNTESHEQTGASYGFN